MTSAILWKKGTRNASVPVAVQQKGSTSGMSVIAHFARARVPEMLPQTNAVNVTACPSYHSGHAL